MKSEKNQISHFFHSHRGLFLMGSLENADIQPSVAFQPNIP